jgi:hypothetical protein
MSDWTAHVFPHGDLLELAPGLWSVTGTLGRSPLPRTMVVYRLKDGGLLIHSAVALDEAGMAALEALGEPRVLVVPNRLHRSDAGVYKERYPELRVCCPEGARKAVEQVVAVDATSAELLPPLGITCHLGGAFEHIYELPLHEGVALVCADSLFHVREHFPGLQGFVMRYITRSTGFFGVTGLGRMFLGKGIKPLKEWLLQQAARDDVRAFVVGHGSAVTSDVAGALRGAAERL